MSDPLLIKLGGIVIQISVDLDIDRNGIANFLTYDEDPEVILNICFSDLPDLSTWEEIFYSGGIWRLLYRFGKYAFTYKNPVLQPNCYQVLIFDPISNNGTIYIHRDLYNRQFLSMNQNLLTLIMVNLLINKEGLVLHACAIEDGKIGRLFIGNSGAGKSTMSQLWADEQGVVVLSDERIILRRQGNHYCIYGTPWHGDADFMSPRSIPLKQIFVLYHSDKNQVKRLNPLKATTLLLARSFPTFWDSKGMDFTLGLLSDLSQSVPCYELGFQPEQEVVNFIRGVN